MRPILLDCAETLAGLKDAPSGPPLAVPRPHRGLAARMRGGHGQG